MVILPILEFFFTGPTYVTYVFLVLFAFGLVFKVVRSS